MDIQKLLDRTRKDLRSVLISAPRGVPTRMLLSDYKMVLGGELPFRELGYSRLEDFLRAIPDVVRLDRGVTGEPTCFAVADASTSQIARFVATQKKPKIKKSNAPPMIRKPSSLAGFTKKSKFGPSSARPKTSPGTSRSGGGRFGGTGNVYTGGPSRYPKSGYGRGSKAPLRPRGPSQHLYRPPNAGDEHLKSPTSPYSSGGSMKASVSFNQTNASSVHSKPVQSNGMYGGGNHGSGNQGYGSGIQGNGPGNQGYGFGNQGNGPGNQGYGFGNQGNGPGNQGNGLGNQNYGFGNQGSSSNQVYGFGNTGYGSGNQGYNSGSSANVNGLSRSTSVSSSSSVTSTTSSIVKSSVSDKIGRSAILSSPPRTGFHSSSIASKSFKTHSPTTIKQLSEWSTKPNTIEMKPLVSVDGFIAREGQHDVSNQTFKYLLYSELDKGKKGVLPAVMLFFKKEAWDIDAKGKDFQTIPVGTKLRVYGQPVRQMSKNKGIYEPAIRIYHYQYEPFSSTPLTMSGSKGGAKWSPIRAPGTSSSSSPPTTSSSSGSTSGVVPPNLDKMIYKLLKARPSGIWGGRLGSEMKKFHGIEPPGDILALALRLPFVECEDISGDPSNPILQLAENFSGLSVDGEPVQEPAVPSSSVMTKPVVSFTTEKPALPGTVELPAAEYLDVCVACIDNPISFYLQRMGEDYSEKLQSMAEALSARLSKHKVKPVMEVRENELYGYQWDEGDIWCRVLTSKVSGNRAEVFFPDYGNSEEVAIRDLVDLPREFYSLPFQAVHCCLHGCTAVGDEATDLFVKHAFEKTCVAQIMDSSGTRVAVELIDSEQSGDTTINSIIMSVLHPVSTLVPKLPNPGDPRVPVILTDIDDEGVITVQLRGPGLNRLQQLMGLINEKFKKAQAADFVKKVKEGKVYCMQFSADKKYYRVKVKEVDGSKLLVEYVDYGNEEDTEIRKLRRPLSDPLFDLPPQAVKCRLHGLPPFTVSYSVPSVCIAAMSPLPSPQSESFSEAVTHYVAGYLDNEDLYLTTVDAGGDGPDSLPSVCVIVTDGEEEGEESVLNDLILQQDFENGLQSTPDSEEDNVSGAIDTGDLGGIASANATALVESGPRHPESDVCVPSTLGPVLKSSTPNMGSSKGGVVSSGSASFNMNSSIFQTKSTDSYKSANLTSPTSSAPLTPSSVPLTPSTPTPSSLSASLDLSPTSSQLSTSSVSAPTTPFTSVVETKVPSDGPLTPQSGTTPSSSFFSPISTTGFSFEGSTVSVNGHSNKEVLPSQLKVASLSSEPQAVQVVWVESPHNFVVQLHSGSEQLYDLVEELNDKVSTFAPLLSGDIRVGVVCCAPSSLDQRWYRVAIESTSNVINVTVRFLDYGSCEEVEVSQLKNLPAQFLALPLQAIPCSLRGLLPLGNEEWSPDASAWFEARVLEKNFYAVEMEKDGAHSYITLLDTSEEKTVDIRDAVKDAGFANLQV